MDMEGCRTFSVRMQGQGDGKVSQRKKQMEIFLDAVMNGCRSKVMEESI